MNCTAQKREAAVRGLTLVEVLIVLILMSIVVSVALPNLNPGTADQLEAAADILIGDLDYGRSLAVSNNSTYEFVFQFGKNRYYLHHTGSNAALETLAASPFFETEADSGGGTRQVTDFDHVLTFGPTVGLLTTRRVSSGTGISSIEFQPLGNTTETDETEIWLTCGEGQRRLYIRITVSPVTGLATAGSVQSAAP
jgi:prepilin-type N-terminal cleavage/methylation domain-containing protein